MQERTFSDLGSLTWVSCNVEDPTQCPVRQLAKHPLFRTRIHLCNHTDAPKLEPIIQVVGIKKRECMSTIFPINNEVLQT